jgi:hypothetical protein
MSFEVQLYQVGSLKSSVVRSSVGDFTDWTLNVKLQTTQLGTTELWKWPQLRKKQLQKFNNDIMIWSSGIFRCSNPMFSPIRCWVSFDIGYFLCLVFRCWDPVRCCVLFDVQPFDVQSFAVQSFKVQSFNVQSFDVQSFKVYIRRSVIRCSVIWRSVIRRSVIWCRIFGCSVIRCSVIRRSVFWRSGGELCHPVQGDQY